MSRTREAQQTSGTGHTHRDKLKLSQKLTKWTKELAPTNKWTKTLAQEKDLPQQSPKAAYRRIHTSEFTYVKGIHIYVHTYGYLRYVCTQWAKKNKQKHKSTAQKQKKTAQEHGARPYTLHPTPYTLQHKNTVLQFLPTNRLFPLAEQGLHERIPPHKTHSREKEAKDRHSKYLGFRL